MLARLTWKGERTVYITTPVSYELARTGININNMHYLIVWPIGGWLIQDIEEEKLFCQN